MSEDLQGFGFVLPHWLYWGWLACMPLVMLYFSQRRAGAPEAAEALPQPGNWLTRVVDWISEASGLFVAFWTVNAVCAYFYEVLMRYVFDMPTIWVHESSYLLFGMQYLLAGAFALLHGNHVRVDILFVKLPERGQVGMDIFTSVFFFIFALALIGTSWTFFERSYAIHETTVETWGIQYWPVKAMMLLGAVLLTLAGISKLIKDIQLFRRLGAADRP